ncbi:hypothetical protein ACFSHT_31925 [Paraburkholderia silviterrae]|uniref:Uncharacterized protein n=1 Tax=Paraburkholderia silviterrae TaxID=2528715 RepID=A0A4R5LZS3_9BURK|nr:hypothetical protein [Paraburkholderia silviterrae]TDG18243.1 hypothetical protein EYW47_34960 [Paraburkholderia silviterrae]
MFNTNHSHAVKSIPVDPDSLLATHIERHIHLYMDFGMVLACLLIFSGAYSAAHMLLDSLW